MNRKVAVITGGSSGMGKYMGKKYSDEGYDVILTGRSKERLMDAIEELQMENAIPFEMDVRNIEKVKEMVAEIDRLYGRIDVLINNAAGNFVCPVEKLSPNGWNSVIDIVLNGTFYCSSEIGKYWITKGVTGNIINMVATYAWNAGAGVAHSAAAKAGVLSLTRTLAVEWGTKYGIRVNAIAPGPIERTGGADKLLQSEEDMIKIKESVPLKRFGKPEEIAELAFFISSEKASYMNGECVTLDGGQWLQPFPF